MARRSTSKTARSTSQRNDVASKQTAASKAKVKAKQSTRNHSVNETLRSSQGCKENEESKQEPSTHRVELPTLNDTSNKAKEKQLLMLLSSCVKEAQLECQLERYDQAMKLYDDLAERYPFVKSRALFWIGKSKIEELRQEPAKAFDVITSGLSACRQDEREHDSLTQAMFQLNRSMRRMPSILSSVKKQQSAPKIDHSEVNDMSATESVSHTAINASSTNSDIDFETTSTSIAQQPPHDDTIASVARKLDMDYSTISDIPANRSVASVGNNTTSNDSVSVSGPKTVDTSTNKVGDSYQPNITVITDTESLGSVSDEEDDGDKEVVKKWSRVSGNVSGDDSCSLSTSALTTSLLSTGNEHNAAKEVRDSENSTTAVSVPASVVQVTSSETKESNKVKTPLKAKSTSSNNYGEDGQLLGSIVVLDQVPVRKKTAEEFGSDTFVSPVRRSVRVNSCTDVGKKRNNFSSTKSMIPNSRQLLKNTGFAYSPNPAVKCRGAPLNAGICHPRSPKWTKNYHTPEKCWSADNAKRKHPVRPPVSPEQASYIKAVEKAFSAKKSTRIVDFTASETANKSASADEEGLSAQRAFEHVRGSVASAFSSAAVTWAPYNAGSKNGAAAAAISPKKLNDTAANTFNLNITAQTHGKCSPTPSGKDMEHINSPVSANSQPENCTNSVSRSKKVAVRQLHCKSDTEAQGPEENIRSGTGREGCEECGSTVASPADNQSQVQDMQTPRRQSSRKRAATNRSTPRRSDRIRDKKRATVANDADDTQ